MLFPANLLANTEKTKRKKHEKNHQEIH